MLGNIAAIVWRYPHLNWSVVSRPVDVQTWKIWNVLFWEISWLYTSLNFIRTLGMCRKKYFHKLWTFLHQNIVWYTPKRRAIDYCYWMTNRFHKKPASEKIIDFYFFNFFSSSGRTQQVIVAVPIAVRLEICAISRAFAVRQTQRNETQCMRVAWTVQIFSL